ncbi:hypothetical protein LCGC14_1413680 [marine sediment metagenome]|uniref:Uncharacterized protein n=1 Tax=marine sediment metagenome TaxID=412755 RepID=A0A0F9MV63_9ZZZZ
MSTTTLYPTGNGKWTVGTWTHNAGEVNETVQVAGIIFGAIISKVDTNGTYMPVQYSVSLSGSVTTVTFHEQSDVTDGRFMIRNSFQ